MVALKRMLPIPSHKHIRYTQLDRHIQAPYATPDHTIPNNKGENKQVLNPTRKWISARTVRGPCVLPALGRGVVLEDLEPDVAGSVEVGGGSRRLSHVSAEGAGVIDAGGGGEGDLAAGLDGGGGGGGGARCSLVAPDRLRGHVRHRPVGLEVGCLPYRLPRAFAR